VRPAAGSAQGRDAGRRYYQAKLVAAPGDAGAKGVGEIDRAAAVRELRAVPCASGPTLCREPLAGAAGQERRAVVGALPATDGDLVAFEVDVLHREGEHLLRAQAGAVQELAEKA
jgi:hypothetical protein